MAAALRPSSALPRASETETNGPHSLGGLYLVLLGLFLNRFMSGILTINEIEKLSLILSISIELGLMLAGFGLLLGKHARLQEGFPIKAGHGGVFLALLVWAVVSIGGGLAALFGGYDTAFEFFPHEFLLGDLYKFLSLVSIFVLYYYSIASLQQVRSLVRRLVVMAGAFDLVILVLIMTGYVGLSWGVQGNYMAIHSAVLPALIYTALEGRGRFGRFAWLVVLEGYGVTFLSQGFAWMFTALLVPVLFVIVRARNPARTALLLSSVILAVGLPVANIFGDLYNSVEFERDSQLYKLLFKSQYIWGDLPALEKIEGLTGGRLTELTTVPYLISQDPTKLITGFGMGSTFITYAIIPEWDAGAGIERHTMHSGFGEALFRTGVVGLSALVYLVVTLTRRSFVYRRFDPLAALAFVYGLTLFGGLIIGTNLAAGYLMFSLMLVATLRIEELTHRKPAPPRPALSVGPGPRPLTARVT